MAQNACFKKQVRSKFVSETFNIIIIKIYIYIIWKSILLISIASEKVSPLPYWYGLTHGYLGMQLLFWDKLFKHFEIFSRKNCCWWLPLKVLCYSNRGEKVCRQIFSQHSWKNNIKRNSSNLTPSLLTVYATLFWARLKWNS